MSYINKCERICADRLEEEEEEKKTTHRLARAQDKILILQLISLYFYI